MCPKSQDIRFFPDTFFYIGNINEILSLMIQIVKIELYIKLKSFRTYKFDPNKSNNQPSI